MSNTLAIAAVTATLRHLFHEALRAGPDAVSGADVTTHHPARLSIANTVATGINVFLYGVTLDAAARRHMLPAKLPAGENAAAFPTAVELNYLITCYGTDASLDPERHVARAIATIVANPVLPADVITAAIAAYAAEPTAFLGHSDLADQIDRVRLSIKTLSLAETSQIWLVLGTPYQPSVACTASGVLL